MRALKESFEGASTFDPNELVAEADADAAKRPDGIAVLGSPYAISLSQGGRL